MSEINESKEFTTVGYEKDSWIVDLGPLKKMLGSEGVKIAVNRQSRLKNGAEKLQVTIYFWPSKQ